MADITAEIRRADLSVGRLPGRTWQTEMGVRGSDEGKPGSRGAGEADRYQDPREALIGGQVRQRVGLG
jgi:hypothetical protein